MSPMDKQKNICLSFLGNANYDSRVINIYSSLKKGNFVIKTVSFEWLAHRTFPDASPEFKVIKIRRRPSVVFYLSFYFSLMKEFLFCKCDYFFAEDVFTLPFASLLKKIKKFSLIYDCRELYPFLAGLRKKSWNQKLVAWLEKKFIYSTDRVLVTGEMDKKFLEDFYGLKNVVVQRNLPAKIKIKPKDLRKEFKIGKTEFILIYQGVLLEGRGIALIIKALQHLENVKFLILGDGDYRHHFENLTEELGIKNKVIFAGRIPQSELLNYTAGADLGLAIIENLSKSYYYALPNKLFEYIASGVPVLVSDLPQMRNVVEKYDVGKIVTDLDEEKIAVKIRELIQEKEKLLRYKNNCLTAFAELNWDVEFEKNKGFILE